MQSQPTATLTGGLTAGSEITPAPPVTPATLSNNYHPVLDGLTGGSPSNVIVLTTPPPLRYPNIAFSVDFPRGANSRISLSKKHYKTEEQYTAAFNQYQKEYQQEKAEERKKQKPQEPTIELERGPNGNVRVTADQPPEVRRVATRTYQRERRGRLRVQASAAAQPRQ